MAASDSVIVFIRHDQRILLLRPANGAGAPWDSIRRDPDGAPLAAAYDAIDAVLGLRRDDVAPPVEGDVLHIRKGDRAGISRLYPVLFDIEDSSGLTLDRMCIERRWAWPGEIDRLDTAPGLADALHSVYTQ